MHGLCNASEVDTCRGGQVGDRSEFNLALCKYRFTKETGCDVVRTFRRCVRCGQSAATYVATRIYFLHICRVRMLNKREPHSSCVAQYNSAIIHPINSKADSSAFGAIKFFLRVQCIQF